LVDRVAAFTTRRRAEYAFLLLCGGEQRKQSTLLALTKAIGRKLTVEAQ